jgi:phage baseplate assembly protein W
MRRDFGSKIFDFVDAKMTAANILGIYAAAAEAIEAWEPRFRAYRASVSAASADGVLGLTLYGLYFPRGHLGDYSIVEDASTRVLLNS